MRQLKAFGLVGVLVLAGSLSVRADVWDVGTVTDNNPTDTRNELSHGTVQTHDLAAHGSPAVADEDWFLVQQEPFSSYIIQVDNYTATLNLGGGAVTLRDASDPNTVVQTAGAVSSAGVNRQIGIVNNDPTSKLSFLRVTPLAGGVFCSTTCDANAQYRVRFFDTTYLVPRFNNSGSQVTVLLLQNGYTHTGVAVTINYWNAAGTLLAQVSNDLLARQSAAINLSTIPELVGQAGTITITHTAGFGGLAVKSVALEPATGFSFDTLGTYRSR